MSATEIKLYNTLKDKLGEKETELLLDYVGRFKFQMQRLNF